MGQEPIEIEFSEKWFPMGNPRRGVRILASFASKPHLWANTPAFNSVKTYFVRSLYARAAHKESGWGEGGQLLPVRRNTTFKIGKMYGTYFSERVPNA